jgi:TPR repeat protein
VLAGGLIRYVRVRGENRRRARTCEVRLKRFRRTAIRAAAAAVVLSFAAQASIAEEYRQFPGAPTDSRTLKIQERVEGIFLSGDYGRSLLIYEKELAPLGDKYAQYMVGFMHLTGKGVTENSSEALAWYRLAAERGEVPFIKARDTLRASLEPAELERSDARFAELWQRYGDRRLILDLIGRDLEILRGGSAQTNGSRVDDAGASQSLAAGYAANETGEGYYRRVRARLAERVQYLSSTKDAAQAGIENAAAIEKLESKVRRELEALDLP